MSFNKTSIVPEQGEIDNDATHLLDNQLIDDIREGAYSFFIGTGEVSIKVTRLGFGDQNLRRGMLSDGNRVIHYELECLSLMKLELDPIAGSQNQKAISWESPLPKGAYKFSMMDDNLENGIIKKLRLSSKSIS